MNLSEAIRLGAMLAPQGFGSPKSAGRVPATLCALEAAAESLGLDTVRMGADHEPVYYSEIEQRYPFLVGVKCPTCDSYVSNTPCRVAWHLNDLHRWTRERIADWVESIEKQAFAECAPECVAVAASCP